MEYALSIENLTKTYKDGLKALKGIDLNIKQGDFFALLGPNGAGKSTAIGIISSLVTKTTGKIKICGVDIDQNFAKAKTFLGVVPQETNFSLFNKVSDVVLDQAGFFGIKRKVARVRMEKYLKLLSLWDKRDTQIRHLSGGMKRRLMLARALMNEPKLLLLDEPTEGVDIVLRRAIWDALKVINQLGTTIVLTTHHVEEAEELCQNIAVINHGEIIADTSIPELIRRLETETFIFDLKSPIAKEGILRNYPVEIISPTRLEVSLSKSQTLNGLYQSLTEDDIEVISMRNKTNRLEEAFVNLIGNTEQIESL